VYLILCVLGTVLPYAAFVPFLRQYGLNPHEFAAQLFATPVSSFFGLDVIVSAVVLWTFVVIDGRREGRQQLWVPIVASLAAGVSSGLPLFLYLREARRDAAARGRGGESANRANATGIGRMS
jgi:hypothetical protein